MLGDSNESMVVKARKSKRQRAQTKGVGEYEKPVSFEHYYKGYKSNEFEDQMSIGSKRDQDLHSFN